MPTMPLTKGQVAIVDDEDYEFLSQWKWTFDRYAYRMRSRQGKKRPWQMHRAVMERVLEGDIPKGYDIDHIDGDGLNNRRGNLRLATRSQNLQNRVGNAKATSKYKGVFWLTRNRKWQASIKIGPKRTYIGLFANEEDAARAYDEKAREAFGEFARLNFPD